MRRILLVLTVAALMAAFLAFGSSGVAFAQDEPAVVADAMYIGYTGPSFGAVFVFPALLLGGAALLLGGAALLRRNNKK
jgi:hypothetical protein